MATMPKRTAWLSRHDPAENIVLLALGFIYTMYQDKIGQWL